MHDASPCLIFHITVPYFTVILTTESSGESMMSSAAQFVMAEVIYGRRPGA